MERERRLIVLGLDGATFDIIHPMIEEKKLPVISKLIEKGCRSILRSTTPPLTVPAWPCFYTGKNPGKFGAYDFFVRNGLEIDRIVTRPDIQANSIWRILSHFGFRSVVLNVPSTYPPEPINGVVVSGMLTPRGRPFVHPPRYKELLDRSSEGYRINEDPSLVNKPHSPEFMQDLVDVAGRQEKSFLTLLKTEQWSFAMMVLRGTDIIQHLLWGDVESIQSFYQLVDSYCGEIIEAFPEANIFLMSDHGFGPYGFVFDLNSWLIEEGYLEVTEEVVDPAEELAGLRRRGGEDCEDEKVGSPVIRWLGKHGLHKNTFRRLLPGPAINLATHLMPRLKAFPDISYKVDFGCSRAHALVPFVAEASAIHIIPPSEGSRDPKSRQDYHSLRSEIMRKLEELDNPHTGRRIFESVKAGEELYWGDFQDSAPDIVLTPDIDVVVPAHITRERGVLYRAEKTAARHRADGIFIACGRDIEPAGLVECISILDLAPTILHFFGLDVDREMDGEVLNIFRSESSRYDHIRTTTYPLFMESAGHGAGTDKDKEVLDRLKGLGYV